MIIAITATMPASTMQVATIVPKLARLWLTPYISGPEGGSNIAVFFPALHQISLRQIKVGICARSRAQE